MNDILEIKALEKEYKEFKLGPISINIPKGYIVGFIGENGSGKSTTIKAILGLIHYDNGIVKIFGKEIAEEIKELGDDIGVVLDDINLPSDLKIFEVGKMCSKIFKNWNQKTYDMYSDKFQLSKKKKVKELSRGMKMKLSLSIALSHNARFLILDEPTSGLDPIVREEILDILLDFVQDENKSVFISSHILSDLEKVADYIAFIHKGKIIFYENKDELYEKYVLYLCGKDETPYIDEKAIVGKTSNEFGKKFLLLREFAPENLDYEKPNIEDIMLFYVKGDK